MEAPDNWRGFTQAKDGLYYLGSKDFGLWQLTATPRPDGIHLGSAFAKVSGAPSESISALVATDDGSVFVGTDGAGLWRMTPEKTFERVTAAGGARVRQLAYDPRFTPTMLFALTDAGLFVLRGW
jgi:ligand-binding sensor domain-containing protein